MARKPLHPLLILGLATGLVVTGQVFPSDRGGVPSSPQEIRPLLIGAKIPEVSVRNSEGTDIALADVLRKKPTILIVYRGGW